MIEEEVKGLPMITDDQGSKKYQTFWRRLVAGTLDFLLLYPLALLDNFAAKEEGQVLAAIVFVTSTVLGIGYYVVLHALRGQTIGKSIMSVRVEDLSGKLPGWRRACLRDIVPLVVSTVALGSGFVNVLAGRSAYYHDGEIGNFELILTGGIMGWFVLEFATMLFNRRRRAIHDLLAGTVVVRT